MSFYLENYGCAANQYDGEVIRTMLLRRGLKEASKPQEASLLILNTCIVKKATEDRMKERLKKLTSFNKPLIVTGCMADALPNKIQEIAPNANIVGLNYTDMISEIAQKAINGEKINVFGKRILDKANLEYLPTSKLIATIPISQGCLGACTFCITRLARGSLVSFSPDKILGKIEKLISIGVKEIRLTGQDLGPYGRDLGTDLVKLLEKICEIEGNFKVRIGMASPDTIEPIIDGILDVMKNCNKIYKFLHLPVQSGSDRILSLMKRNYTSDLFLELVRKSRKKIGDITIATDIIVAFPTETDEDHYLTMKLIEKTKPDVVNISRYGDRPFTPASRMKPKIHSGVAKKRSSELARLVREISLERNKRYVGKTLNALMLECDGKSRVKSRLDNYKLVYVDVDGIDNPDELLGFFHRVKINDATWKALYGTRV